MDKPETNKLESFEANLSDFEKADLRDYLNCLQLDPEDLRGKNILDAGAGMRMFAAALVHSEISENVYSLEPFPRGRFQEMEPSFTEAWESLPPKVQKKVDEKTIVGSYEKIPLPDGSMDAVVVKSATPGGDWNPNGPKRNETEKNEEVDKSLDEFVRVLKPGCEARIWPANTLYFRDKVKELFAAGMIKSEWGSNLLIILKPEK